MLVRAATRRVPRDVLRRQLRPIAPSESIHLPWLYPSFSTPFRFVSSIARPAPKKLEKTQSINGRAFNTSTAAVPEPEYDDVAMYGNDEAIGSFTSKQDPSLVILDTPDPPSVVYANGASTQLTENEILSTFQACITSGMLARAQLMLLQLHQLLDKDAPELVSSHNCFLDALLNKVDTDSSHLKLFFMWYEERMKGKYNIKADVETYALLLKGSLRLPNEDIGKQYLKHYMGEAKRAEVSTDGLLSNGILTRDEATYVAKSCGIERTQLSPYIRDRLFKDEAPPVRPSILSIPEVTPTIVRGHGLAAIKQSLRSLIDPEYIPQGTDSQGVDPIERQKLLEDDAIQSALDRWKKDAEERSESGILAKSRSLNALLWDWHSAFVPLIKQELGKIIKAEREMDAGGHCDRTLYGPFMRLLDVDKISAITILEILKVCNEAGPIADGVKSSRAVMAVGRMLENEVLSEELKKRAQKTPKELLANLFTSATKFNVFVKRARMRAAEGLVEPEFAIRDEWPPVIKAKLGAVLISMLMHCAKVTVSHRDAEGVEHTQDQSAILHGYQFVRGRKLGILRLHNDVIKRLGVEPLRGGIISRHLPMIVRPRPWLGPKDGGYYYFPVKAVRTKDSKEQDLYVKAAAARGDLDQLFAGLDVLGSTSWAINERVFNIVLNVWNTGIAVADVPAREAPIAVPEEPPVDQDPLVRFKWMRERRLALVTKKNHHSLRCDVNFKLEIARAFLQETFYFPHNVDFRGRAYPVPPHLNHIGNDLCRGLLTFAEGRELGESGLRWLKIHLSNVYGFDKASFSEREAFSNEHINQINDSVENPIDGERWWLEAEDPWQCLAACIALYEAQKLPDPTKYKCKLPVAQDGTCNGLQHYAALGGDIVGARQVNLEPSDRPQDVYTGVAELVRAAVKRDAERGEEMAKTLQDLITRKVVKQTVMTNVYGVTFIGAKAQIHNQLRAVDAIPKEELSAAALYLTRKVFDSVRTMFNGAHNIQEWLGQCAWRISRAISPTQMKRYAQGETESPEAPKKRRIGRPNHREKSLQGKLHYMTSVVWTTPLGLPVVQPYRNKNMQTVATNLQNVFISDPNIIDEVNSRKQMSAFPPNYIHSLDATHMLLSALECHRSGLTFAAVHDSFWTHPSDVDTLNQILRDAFINLHSSDLVKRLRDEFKERYKGYKYLASYPETSVVGVKIRNIRLQFFREFRRSMTASEELIREMERDRLLASTNPEEQAQGQAMVTPASIIEAASPADFKADSVKKDEISPELAELVGNEMAEGEITSTVVKLGSEETVGADVDMTTDIGDMLGEKIILDEVDDAELAPVDETPTRASKASAAPKASKVSKGSKASSGTTVEDDEMEHIESMLSGHDLEDTAAAKAEEKKKAPRKLGRSANALDANGKPVKKDYRAKRVSVWQPLMFPDVPKKGDFDVSRLEHSKYFFS